MKMRRIREGVKSIIIRDGWILFVTYIIKQIIDYWELYIE